MDALALARTASNESMQANALYLVGEAHRLAGEEKECIRFANQAIKMFHYQKDDRMEATVHISVAEAWCKQMFAHEALAAVKKAVILYKRCGDKANADLAKDFQEKIADCIDSRVVRMVQDVPRALAPPRGS